MSELMPLLMRETGLSEHDVTWIASTAPSRYKSFLIEKRRGGSRRIAQPAREVKILQRILVEHVLSKLPVHAAAKAYRIGTSIRDNAAAHAGHGPILKYDFQDFFPSIHAVDWERYCDSRKLLPDPVDRWLTTRILFHREKGSTVLRLAIGAPSSPVLSNILMFDFDTRIARAVAREKVTYTRYADDLTFSAKRTGFLTRVEPALRSTIRALVTPRLTLNEKKTVLATTKFRRQVTGLVLTNDGAVSIGRDKKRRLRAALYQESQGLLSPTQRAHLCGMLAFVNAVEPTFLDKLRAHFGDALVEGLKSDARTSKRPPYARRPPRTRGVG